MFNPKSWNAIEILKQTFKSHRLQIKLRVLSFVQKLILARGENFSLFVVSTKVKNSVLFPVQRHE